MTVGGRLAALVAGVASRSLRCQSQQVRGLEGCYSVGSLEQLKSHSSNKITHCEQM